MGFRDFFDNKTILIIGLILIAVLSIFFNVKDLALAVASGLVGYLSKDSNVEINHHNTDNNNGKCVIDDDFEGDIK